MLDLVGHLKGESAADLVTVFEEKSLVGRRRQLKSRLWRASNCLGSQVRSFGKQAAHKALLLRLLLFHFPLEVEIGSRILFLRLTAAASRSLYQRALRQVKKIRRSAFSGK